jgi:hypothetical protein
MNKTLLITALLATFTAILHTIGGTLEIEKPLLTSSLSPEISLLLLACWHLVSATLCLSSIAYFFAAKNSHPNEYRLITQFISTLWISFGLVFVVIDLAYAGPQMLLILPQWILLIPIGALGLWGARKNV